MEEKQLPKEVELITEDRLKELGFEFIDYGDNPPYETYRKDGIEVSEYNGECWLIEMLDQNNIEHPIKYLSELEAFFNGCGKSIYGATAYAAKLHQANETIKVLEYDNNKLKGQVEGYKEAHEDHQRLVRHLDLLINGDAASEQASLCDLVKQIGSFGLPAVNNKSYKEESGKLTQSRADLIREANNRDLGGTAGREEACDFAEWMRLNCMSSQNGWVDGLGKWDTTKGWYDLFKQQKEK